LPRCRRIPGNEAAAQDALQETFMRLWRRPDLFAVAESKLAWIYRIADNCSFDHLSQPTTRAALPAGYSPAFASLDPHFAPPVEERDTAFKFLAALNAKLRRVAFLHLVDEMGQEEIARAVGCSRQTVVNRLAAIKQRAKTFQGKRWAKVLTRESPSRVTARAGARRAS
jgi:RNA polymerase sigma-70 factor (ECF subfamily)